MQSGLFHKGREGANDFRLGEILFRQSHYDFEPNLIHIRNRMGKVAKIVQTVEN
jgi:hypothetical protein